MNTEIIKGFRDFIGEEAEKRQQIKEILAKTFRKYGFEVAETPMIESEEFVKGENKEDEAVSDIYKLKDKGERNLALRYEFTFQLKRIANNKKLPYKKYQIGEVFRDEPTNSRRFRQFTQCDIDTIGSTTKDEAEILAVANEVLNKIEIKNEICVGNRKLINEILEKEAIKDKQSVLREIDKFDKLTEKEILIVTLLLERIAFKEGFLIVTLGFVLSAVTLTLQSCQFLFPIVSFTDTFLK